eukprot:10342508-Alexandrium_andersonii.AAC.1
MAGDPDVDLAPWIRACSGLSPPKECFRRSPKMPRPPRMRPRASQSGQRAGGTIGLPKTNLE